MGNWTVTDPGGIGAYWGDADCWAHGGTHSAACAAAGPTASACDENYLPDMKTWLIHGPFSLADTTLCYAEFLFSLHLVSETDFDWLFAGVSTDGTHFEGDTWTGIVEDQVSMDLAPLLGEPQVWIGFRFFSDPSLEDPNGAQIDDVAIMRYPPPTPSEARFGWTLSESPTDPRVHIGDPTHEDPFIYLWYYCSAPAGEGLVGADFQFNVDGGIFLDAVPMNGFLLNRVGPRVTLTSATCQMPPVLAARLNVRDYPTMSVCLDECTPRSSTDCVGTKYGIYFVGHSTWPRIPCQSPTLCSDLPQSVEETSWGAIKGYYR
jgi:hypothetical protein